MQTNNQKAFTMVELIFVIVIIGILAAVALPKFGESANQAYLSKAKNAVAIIQSAVTTERQKMILRGDAGTDIESWKIPQVQLSSMISTVIQVIRH